RLILRDMIFSSQRRNNQGILQHSIHNLRREPLYQEILHYSYQSYFEKFALPYYSMRGTDSTRGAFEQAGDLPTSDARLRDNPSIRIVVKQDDFLLVVEDLAWFHATFSPEQLTVFAQGGPLGNLFSRAVQKTILGALSGVKASPTGSNR